MSIEHINYMFVIFIVFKFIMKNYQIQKKNKIIYISFDLWLEEIFWAISAEIKGSNKFNFNCGKIVMYMLLLIYT